MRDAQNSLKVARVYGVDIIVGWALLLRSGMESLNGLGDAFAGGLARGKRQEAGSKAYVRRSVASSESLCSNRALSREVGGTMEAVM